MPISPDRVATELQKAKGVLVQLTRKEFEDRVQKAALIQSERKTLPRLIVARYSAQFSETALSHGHLQGNAQWKIENPASGTAIFPLPSLNLALQDARFVGQGKAILGELAGKNLALFVETAGSQDLIFDWSARGTPVQDGWHFELQVPPCPVSSLEITLPLNYGMVSASEGVLLSGPREADSPKHKRWQLDFSGCSSVEFDIRQTDLENAPALLMAQSQSKQQLSPERLLADFEFQIEALHGSVQDLQFLCDPQLQPYEVSLRNREIKDWQLQSTPEVKEPKGKKILDSQGHLLIVRLREPVQGILAGLRIRCLGPGPKAEAWTSPWMRLRQLGLDPERAVPRGEKLRLELHPDLHLEKWHPGKFRLSSLATEINGGQTIFLDDTGHWTAPLARPTCWFKAQGIDVRALQNGWWRLEGKTSQLYSEITYDLSRGRLFQLALKLPKPGKNWQVEQVELEPKDLLRSWTVSADNLLVELQRSLDPRKSATLKVWLRSNLDIHAPAKAMDLDLPDLTPFGPKEQMQLAREGTLEIAFDSLFQGRILKNSIPWTISTQTSSAKESKAIPRFSFVFRDQPLAGQLRLSSRHSGTKLSEPELLQSEKTPLIQSFHPPESCEQARLITFVEPDGKLKHHFQVQVWNWTKSSLTMVLPKGTIRAVQGKIDDGLLSFLQQEKSEDGIRVHFPMARDKMRQKLEIVYFSETSWSAWPRWTSLSVPSPLLPLPPSSIETLWCLPPGLRPLESNLQEKTLVYQRSGDWEEKVQRIWQFGNGLFSQLLSGRAEETSPALDLNIQGRISRKMTLGEALGKLAREEQAPMVLDVAALQSLGLNLQTNIGGKSDTPFWEPLGLALVSCPPGVLLTSQHQLELWNSSGTKPGAILQESFRDAQAHGRDRQGRFQTIPHWLFQGSKEQVMLPEIYRPGWSVWESAAGNPQPEFLTLVDQRDAHVVGLVLALGSAFLVWKLSRSIGGRGRFQLLVLWVGGSFLAWLWLPPGVRAMAWWSVLAGLAGVLVGYLLLLTQKPTPRPGGGRSTERMPKAALDSATMLLLGFGMSSALLAQPATETFTVFLLEGSQPKQQMVLVNPDLLKKLEQLSVPQRPGGPVVVQAHYQGQIKGNLAEIKGEFYLYHFGEQASLVLPLGGVELKENQSFLEGKPIFPVPAPQTGYLIPIRQKGWQRLVLMFTAPVQGTAEYGEVRFSIPRLAQSDLTFTLPSALQDVQVVSCQGKQEFKGELQAVLGSEGVVHLRWRSEKAALETHQLGVREAYFYDLRLPAATLTGLLQYSVSKGTVSSLSLALPEGMEIRALEIVGANAKLKNWQLIKNKLDVHLAGPASGTFQMHLYLYPRFTLGPGKLILRLPLPLGATPLERGHLAYRLEGLDFTDKALNLGVDVMAPELFSKAWRAKGRDPGPPTRVYSFLRPAKNPGGLEVTQSLPKIQARQDIAWKVYPLHADFLAKIHVGSSGDLMLLEWEVPQALDLTDVRGPDVHHWSRIKSDAKGAKYDLVQIWLQQPRKETTLELVGWGKNALKPKSSPTKRFNLTAIRPSSFKADVTHIQVAAGPGTSLDLESPFFLTQLPSSSSEWIFETSHTDYGATFEVRPLSGQAEVKTLTELKIHDGTAHFHGKVECQTGPGSLGQLRIRVLRWPGDLHLETPGIATKYQRENDQHFWTIFLPGAIHNPLNLEIVGQMALPRLAELEMPDILVEGSTKQETWLAVTGAEMRPLNLQGLEAVKDFSREFRSWPVEAERIRRSGKAWKIKDKNWRLALHIPFLEATSPVRLILGEQESVVTEGRNWLHQGHFLLFTLGAREVPVHMPPGAQLRGAVLNGQWVEPRRQDGKCLFLLKGEQGLHSLHLRWSYAQENLDQPKLEMPSFPGIPQEAILGRLVLPPGYSWPVFPEASLFSRSEPQFLLRRTQARVELCEFLAKGARKEGYPMDHLLLDQQRLIFKELDLLEMFLGQGSNLSPMKIGWHNAVQELRRHNQQSAEDFGFSHILAKAQKSLRQVEKGKVQENPIEFFSLGRPGPSQYWQADAQGKSPVLHFPSLAQEERRHSVVASQILLIVLLGSLLLSYLPRFLRTLLSFWPEQLIFLGGLGWYFFDNLSLLGFILIGVGVLCRVALLIRWLARYLSKVFSRKNSGSTSGFQPISA